VPCPASAAKFLADYVRDNVTAGCHIVMGAQSRAHSSTAKLCPAAFPGGAAMGGMRARAMCRYMTCSLDGTIAYAEVRTMRRIFVPTIVESAFGKGVKTANALSRWRARTMGFTYNIAEQLPTVPKGRPGDPGFLSKRRT